MKQYLLATISSLALVGTATAADMPVHPTKAPMGAPLAPSWTGPYIGLNGGFVRHRAKADYGPPVFALEPSRASASGGTIGAQVGYNWQLDNNFVAGLEADFNWVGGSKSTTNADGTIFRSRLPWLATFRARAGVTLSPTLLYVTGGLAVGRVKNDADLFGAGLAGFQIENHQTRTGWTVGAGIEHMFGHNWTAKAEVLYVDLGRKTSSSTGAYTGRFKNTAVIGRVGINLKW